MTAVNPVGTWAQPDSGTQSAAAYKINIENSIAVAKRFVDSFAPHETYEGSPAALGMKVTLDAGYIWDGTSLAEVAAQTTAAFVAPVSNPRIDRIVISAAGAYSRVAGTEAGSPSAPAIPAGSIPVCRVALTVGMSTITNQAITDERPAGLISSILAIASLILGAAALPASMVNGIFIAGSTAPSANPSDGFALTAIDENGAGTRWPQVRSEGGSIGFPPLVTSGGLLMKKIDIGDWNMNANATVAVAHGLTASKICGIMGVIRDDTPTAYFAIGVSDNNLGGTPSIVDTDRELFILGFDSTNITIGRGANFDSATYDATSYNRGFLVVFYLP